MRFFAKAARVIVLFRVPPFRRIFLRSSAPKQNCAHFLQMLPPIFRRRSSRSFTGPCTKCGMRFIRSLSKCRSLRRSAARHRNLSKPATGFSACSLIFLRRLVSKSNRCFRTREICAQQSDQPCCICTAEVPASAVLLFASLHLLHSLHAPFSLAQRFSFAYKCLLRHYLSKKNPDRRRQVQHLTNFLDLAQRKFGFTSCLSIKCASAHVQKLAHFPDLDSLCLHSVVQCLRVHDVHLLCKCPLRHYIIIPFSNVKNYFCLLRYFYVA